MDLTRDEWLAALDMSMEDVPQAVIMEGSWWRAERTEWRLGYLEDVKELAFPDMFHGRWRGTPVVYSCVYGAPRAVELAHLFGVIGTPRMIMIGTCGALDSKFATGDVVVPSQAIAREAVAQLYDAADPVSADAALTASARSSLHSKGLVTHDSLHLTWSSIFAQSGQMIDAWGESGYGSVDMETATLFAVASYFGFEAAALLVVWDLLDDNKSFLDPLPPAAAERLEAANGAVFETALEVATRPNR